jgi:hypothetical protein
MNEIKEASPQCVQKEIEAFLGRTRQQQEGMPLEFG